MPNPDKKRRAEKELKELWQYIDAKYFVKIDKNQIISKIDQILKENGPQYFTDISSRNLPKNSKTSETNSPFPNGNYRKRPNQQIGFISPDDQNQISSRKSQRVTGSQSKENRLGDQQDSIVSLSPRDLRKQDSIFSSENIEAKGGFRQLYSDIMDKLNLTTNWSSTIDRSSKNVEFQDKLEKSIIHAQIRNMFDIEFNKKYQGSITLPLKQQKSITHPSQSVHNKYLFFITDKFEDESKIESDQKKQLTQREEKLKLMHFEQKRQLRIKAIEDKLKNSKPTQVKEINNIEEDAGALGFLGVTTVESSGQDQVKKEEREEGGRKFSHLGFITSMSEDDDQIEDCQDDASFVEPIQTLDEADTIRMKNDKLTLIAAPDSNSFSDLPPPELMKEATLDEEIANLERIYSDTQERIAFDLNQLKKRVVAFKEPESVQILQNKIDKEREYIQTQIIQMEIKQIAESITRVTHAKKISTSQSRIQEQYQSMLAKQMEKRQTRGMVSAQESSSQRTGKKSPASQKKSSQSPDKLKSSQDRLAQDLSKENVGFKNRPLLLVKQLQNDQKEKQANEGIERNDHGKHSQSSNSKQSIEHIFRLEFDPSTGIPPSWVDTKTLNYFNTLRDNIFASSGQYDMMVFPMMNQQQNGQGQNKFKAGAGQMTVGKDHLGAAANPKTTQNSEQFLQQNKHSVAFQRGKRSCTMTDLANKGKMDGGKILSGTINKSMLINGKKSVGSIKGKNNYGAQGGMIGKSLMGQGQHAIKNQQMMNGGEQSAYADYDFCHNCKQLKNKYLLVSCKYSSKASQKHGGVYTPYPYEPQNYTVNNVKIHNIDFQNRSQMRGLIESIRKDLRLKNTAIDAAKQAMQQYIDEEGTERDFDVAAFQQNNQQLLQYLQELDINPYTLDPQKQHQFFTDIKLLFPNLYSQLYPALNSPKQSSSPPKIGCKSPTHIQAQLRKNIDYECKRKFCTFCLRTNYEEHLNDIMKNKNWHCHHCTGYCFCTRCLRQEIITQLKAYLISLGGNLNILMGQSGSVFDSMILKNYNEHLELTLGQNQWLYQKYPYFLQMLMGQNFKDPTCDAPLEGRETLSFSRLELKQSSYDEQESGSNPCTNLGFIGSLDDLTDKLENGQRKAKNSDMTFNSSNKIADEKHAISLLFRFSMLNKKIDDQNNAVCLQNKGWLGSGLGDIGQRVSDKRSLEQIIRSIKNHDQDVVNRIQKRRGRKKFILSSGTDDHAAQDSSYTNCLNKRDQKYLNKIIQMFQLPSDSSLSPNSYSKSNQSLINGDLREFQDEWPKSSSKSIQQIDKMLNSFGLYNLVNSDTDNANNISELGKLIAQNSKSQKAGIGQKNAKYSLNVGKNSIISNDKKSFIIKRGKVQKSKQTKGKVLRLGPQVANQTKKNPKK